ncbi:MAG: DUF6163 family protein [Notoacmeibacter sp.]
MRFAAEEDRRKRRASPLPGESLFQIFNRMLGLVALCFAILAMARLIGVPALSPSRFDLMPIEWRTVTTMLTILYAAAGFGLWQITRWGPVIWVVACLIQILMHTALSQYFGKNDQLIFIIIGLLTAYFLFLSYIYVSKRKRRFVKY